MIKKCKGCGINLQSQDKAQPGYVPEDVLEQEEAVICQRCYRLKNYAKFEPLSFTEDDYLRSVKDGLNRSDAVLYVVDIIDFAGSWQPAVLDLIGDKPWVLVLSKIDLLPEKMSINQLKKWVFAELKDYPQPSGLVLFSSAKKDGLIDLRKAYHRALVDKKNLGIIGMTNAGKSSLLNCLINDQTATVSKFPGTTLGVTSYKLHKDDINLIDTPGLIPEGRISDLLCPECNLKLIPSREISRKTYRLEAGKVLFFGGLVSITILDGENAHPTLMAFAASGVKFHRTKEERRDELWQAYDLLSPPCTVCGEKLHKLGMKTENIVIADGEDLAFPGLGWISACKGPINLEVTLPENIQMIKRNALVMPEESPVKKNRSDRNNRQRRFKRR